MPSKEAREAAAKVHDWVVQQPWYKGKDKVTPVEEKNKEDDF